MRVKIESTGGFAGRTTVVAQYDTADLPAGRAGRVRAAVDALAAAQARGDEGEIGADLPAYRITVQEQDEGAGAGEGAAEGTRVYEVRGDPTAGVSSVLGILLQGPSE
ncbi:protealysin inhibitor emfourin [Actinomadura sp. 9N215]|uniref:protealysin inhibitor emfourin n=1 Tax=Actinomadura sp. 9N215 TaxID=3375150 RepID=UPI0037BB71AF